MFIVPFKKGDLILSCNNCILYGQKINGKYFFDYWTPHGLPWLDQVSRMSIYKISKSFEISNELHIYIHIQNGYGVRR